MAENFEKTLDALVSGIESHLSTRTVMGEPITCGDTTIFPMAEVSFGIAAGSFQQEKKNNGTGGVGAKMTPTAVLVVQNGTTRIIDIKDKTSVNKLLNMLPELVDKIGDLVKTVAGKDAAPSEEISEEI